MESRQSRMNKYYDSDELDETTNQSSRTKRNQELYKEVSSLELEDFDLNSNASVIGNNTDNINLDDIKDILDKKYNVNSRSKSFGDTEEINLPKINLDETREYDLNSILKQAKEVRETTYEEDRLKKIRNTQYDILKSLDIINKDDEIEEEDLDKIDIVKRKDSVKTEVVREDAKDELLDLIDTVSAKELIKQESELQVTGDMDPLDILSDLRGDDEATKVMGMLTREIEEAEKENSRSKDDEDTLSIEPSVEKEQLDTRKENHDEVTITKIEEINEDLLDTKEHTGDIYDSFVGKTTTFSQRDFSDFDDLKNDMKITKVIIKILIFLIIVLFIAGIVVILNKHFGLGLF